MQSIGRIFSFASGKGGVGKTITTVSIAQSLKTLGYNVLIFDGDLGLSNVNIVLGLQARYNIGDVLDGAATLKDVILEGPNGIRVIPSGSGLSQLADLTPSERLKLTREMRKLDEYCDVLLIDTGAGISGNVTTMNALADEVTVVTTPEPHSLTDAYAFIKVMAQRHAYKKFNIIVNMVRTETEGLKVFRKLSEVAFGRLGAELRLLGCVPYDPAAQRAILGQQVGHHHMNHTISGQVYNNLTRRWLESLPSASDQIDSGTFFQSILEVTAVR